MIQITNLFLLLPLASILFPRAIEAAISCNSTFNPCADLLWEGSQCIDGYCSNPFQGGCLRSLLGSEKYADRYADADEAVQALRRRVLSKPRVCNSGDSLDKVEKGLCSLSDNEYMEIRMYMQNWSVFVLVRFCVSLDI